MIAYVKVCLPHSPKACITVATDFVFHNLQVLVWGRCSFPGPMQLTTLPSSPGICITSYIPLPLIYPGPTATTTGTPTGVYHPEASAIQHQATSLPTPTTSLPTPTTSLPTPTTSLPTPTTSLLYRRLQLYILQMVQ